MWQRIRKNQTIESAMLLPIESQVHMYWYRQRETSMAVMDTRLPSLLMMSLSIYPTMRRSSSESQFGPAFRSQRWVNIAAPEKHTTAEHTSYWHAIFAFELSHGAFNFEGNGRGTSRSRVSSSAKVRQFLTITYSNTNKATNPRTRCLLATVKSYIANVKTQRTCTCKASLKSKPKASVVASKLRFCCSRSPGSATSIFQRISAKK